jgi:hypothetical protein
MEPTTGIEPVDLFLTKEALYRLSYVGDIKQVYYMLFADVSELKNGAGDEARTRDSQLGRLALYQLSYSRSNATLRSSQECYKNNRLCNDPIRIKY